MGDFVAGFEALAQAADVTVPLGQDILSAAMKGGLEVYGRWSLMDRDAAFSLFCSNVAEDMMATTHNTFVNAISPGERRKSTFSSFNSTSFQTWRRDQRRSSQRDNHSDITAISGS
ncbi:hypothetical protein N7509_014104 [Penicillium cosmopolitanum]|uniref:Uncharacterized protein n=1 Tax=Penicillium cosmopolitanum TaxID=1131564 RepID=A0A9W9V5I5_9EURO|nr:uncharacterized protein N7509_014104 [Penicillium cosmopolitanum]KAJ5369492.1 hypothetical protein N7509_014104 [Penicillium cosmopolitanum]